MTTSLCYSVGAVHATEEACVLCGCCIQSDLREQNNEFASNFVTFKMTEQIEQQICIKFCVTLEHSSMEIIRMIQKATSMGNWWLATSLWQWACSCITSHVVSWQNIKSPRSLSVPTAQIWYPVTSGFSQIKNHFCREEISRLSMRFRKIWQGSRWQLGELCAVPRYLLWREMRHHCPVYNVSFIVSCIFFNKCLYFSYYMGGHILYICNIYIYIYI